MHINIVYFGKIKEANLAESEQEYVKRLKNDLPLRIISLAQSKSKISPQTVMAEEAKTLLAQIKPNDYLVILDEYGTQMTSKDFAAFLQQQKNQSRQEIFFAIGGPYGWDESIRKRADFSLSLSKLTFPAHVAKFLLIEQLYRATSILNGHPYHK